MERENLGGESPEHCLSQGLSVCHRDCQSESLSQGLPVCHAVCQRALSVTRAVTECHHAGPRGSRQSGNMSLVAGHEWEAQRADLGLGLDLVGFVYFTRPTFLFLTATLSVPGRAMSHSEGETITD